MNEADRYLEKIRAVKPPDLPVSASHPPAASQTKASAYHASQNCAPGIFNNWWAVDGRISRTSYILSVLAVAVPFGILRAIVAFSGASGIDGAGDIVFLLIAEAVLFPQSAKRFHDLGHPTGLAALLFVPLISFFARIYLFISPGSPDANIFGNPPKGVSS